MTKIITRIAKESDLPILYEFEQGIILAERPMNPQIKEGAINYYDLKAMLISDEAEVFVAISEDQVIGSAYVKIQQSKNYLKHEFHAYLGFMFVKPEFRGRGVNRLIMDRLKVWAKDRNINELQLDVYSENHSAIKAYEKAGFAQHLITMRTKI